MEILVESSQAIRQFLRDHGYTEESFSQLGLVDLPSLGMAEQSNSSWTVAGDARLDLLIRLFYLGHTVAADQGQRVIPKEILRDLGADIRVFLAVDHEPRPRSQLGSSSFHTREAAAQATFGVSQIGRAHV